MSVVLIKWRWDQRETRVSGQKYWVWQILFYLGTIRTKKQLDYETMSSASFTVRVFDLGEPQLSSDVTASVYIAILDVNDCMPRFLESEYNLSLLVPPYPDARLLQVHITVLDMCALYLI